MQHTKPGWKKQRSRYLYQSQWYNVRQDDVSLPNNDEIIYTIIEHPGYAVIVPLLDDGRVVMERIYRYTLQCTQLECPSGGLDGEPPEVAARRELEEETGYRAGRLQSLGSYSESSGLSDAIGHFFLATELTNDGQLCRENTEQMELELIPLEELYQAAVQQQLSDGPTALAILLAYHCASTQKHQT